MALAFVAGSSLLVNETLAQALPTGGQVAAGSGTITQTAANALLIRQATDRLAINWQSFNIGAGNSVRFEQPSISSIALNRVLGTGRSEIYGNLSANGQVFLLNPNGVLFGRTAQVDVGGLVASTLKLTDRDFLDGRYVFNDGNSTASIVNEGQVSARDGGYLALIGHRVVNQGTMEAHRGSVVLGAGGSARLTLADNRLVSFEVTQGALDALAENGGLIRANGGQVIMTAGARDSLLASAVNNTGVIEAQTVERQPGNVLLLSGMEAGTTTVGGRIDASAPAALNPAGGDGGFVETSGAHVKVTNSARIDRRADSGRAGTWLIDPKDYTIAATGGDISGTTLSANLALGSVTIESSGGGAVGGNAGSGDVNVNDAVSWSANTLTLTAARDVNINAVMTAGGTSTLVMNPATANGSDAANSGGLVRTGFDSNGNFSGRVDFGSRSGSGFLSIGGQGYTVINTLADLQGINASVAALSGRYALGADIDASSTATQPFTPIGGTQFEGSFNGLGHVIDRLTVNQPGVSAGLFRLISNQSSQAPSVGNLGLSNASITGGSQVGALAGSAYAVIYNTWMSGTVTGQNQVGGLVGSLSVNSRAFVDNSHSSGTVSGSGGSVGGLVGYGGSISRSDSSATVTGKSAVGGLIGSTQSSITDSHATGTVTASGSSGLNVNVGGLAGSATSASITGSYATGAVVGHDQVGGLVGQANGTSSIQSSYATGNVQAQDAAGGLVGDLDGTIDSSYATGNVTVTSGTSGGLVGRAAGGGISNSHATGAVTIAVTTGNAEVGGLVGSMTSGDIVSSYATGNVSALGISFVGGLVGEMAADIRDSHASGNVLGKDTVGGLAGHTNGAIRDSHALGAVSGANNVGGLVGSAGASIERSYAGGDVSGRGGVGGLVGFAGDNASITISQSHATGNVSGIIYVGGLVGVLNASSIDASHATGVVTGTAGLVGGQNGQVGGLVGWSSFGSSITNSYATGNVNASTHLAGGLVGFNFGTIDNSYATGNVSASGQTDVGGLVGNNWGDITNSHATGSVSGADHVGGLVGTNIAAASISDSHAAGAVSGTSEVGGLVGQALGSGAINRSHASGNVSGQADRVGGLVGQNASTASVSISESSAAGDVTGGNNVGGLVGYQNSRALTNSYATGNVTGNDAVGGLVGIAVSGGLFVERSHASGNVTGATSVGGLVGITTSASTAVSFSYATGNANGTNFVGGLVGSNAGFIQQSYATGAVTGQTSVGGLAGEQGNAFILQTYATGAVTGQSDVGGLVGSVLLGASVNDSYATGRVQGVTNTGGLVGSAPQSVFQSFWDVTTSGQATSAGGSGVTSAQMRQQATFSGANWTITSVGGPTGMTWRIYDGRTTPLLASLLTPLTITADNVTRQYDATSVGLRNAQFSDAAAAASGNIINLATPYGAVAKNNVGSYTAELWSNQQGYNIEFTGGDLTVTPAPLAVTGLSAANRSYNTTAVATLTGTATVTPFGSDAVILGGTPVGAFADKNAGTAKAVTVTGSTISGADAGNYTLLQQAGLTANITPANLQVTGLSAVSRTYDGTTAAALNGTASIAPLGTDAVTLGGTAVGAFADKNTGIGKAVTVSGNTISGADAGNYNLLQASGLTADISAKALTVGGITAANRTYDGTTAATVSTAGATYTGLISGDAVTVSATGTFADKNVGLGKTVALASSYTGADAGNYSITNQASTTADISARALSIGGITAANRTYDGTASATVSTSGATYAGLVAGDAVTVSATGSFGDKNVGTAKTVTLASSYTGSDVGNYSITNQASTTADISAKALTVGGITAANRTYDGTTSATVSTAGATYTGLISGDAVTVSATGAFANKNVGLGKAVTLASSYTGADVGNYSITNQASTTADISARALTIGGITAGNRTYDGTTSATISTAGATYAGLVSGDAVTVSATGTFGDKNVGTAKAVTLSSSYAGADVSNYSITNQVGTTANISARALTVGGIAASNKVYDGDVSATVSTAGASYTGLVTGDAVTVSAIGEFVDKNVGTAKAVMLASSYSGVDVSNYSITTQAITTADISAKALSVGGITASNKTYDGTTSATVSTTGATYAGLVAGDAVTVSATGSFANKNVGLGKTVTLASSYTGADVSNYSITNQASTTADISARGLTISGLTAGNKTYDGNAIASISTAGATYAGLVSGDAVTVSATGTFGDKNVGTGKTVTLASSYTGSDVGNYSITDQTGTTANISARGLTIGGIRAFNKTYDGNTIAIINTTGATYAGLVSGDDVTVSATGTFADKNKGTGKTVTLTSSYTGADVGNYSITDQASATARISAAGLTIAGITASDKTYDGNTTAVVSTAGATYAGLVAGDAVTVSASGAFGDKNVGTGKTVALTSSYTGADVANYLITDQASTTANISARALTVGGIAVGNKTYDGTTTATISTTGATYAGLVSGDAVTVNATAAFGDKNAGLGKTVALVTSYTGADASNYAITSQASTTADIVPRALTVTALDARKTYGSTYSFAGTDFSATGLAIGDRIDAVALTSAGAAAAAPVASSPYAIQAGAAQGANFLSGNYNVTYVPGNLVVDPAALAVTARSLVQTVGGAAFRGGNGVDFSGLVNGETASVLSGQLAYSGTAQGAINPGGYSIIPGGLASTNYVIRFVPGTLTLEAAPVVNSPGAQAAIVSAQTSIPGGGITGGGSEGTQDAFRQDTGSGQGQAGQGQGGEFLSNLPPTGVGPRVREVGPLKVVGNGQNMPEGVE